MATKTTIEYYDDLNGNVGASTVKFMLDGVHYEIDLDSENEAALRESFRDYIAFGRRSGQLAKASTQPRRNGGGSQSRAKQDQNAEIRAWGVSAGHEVPARGRIPVAVKQGYFEVHPHVAEVLR